MITGEIITAGIGVFTTAASAFITWIFAKRKYNSEVDSTVIKNLEKSLEIYKTIADDANIRVKEMIETHKAEIKELVDNNKKLEQEVQDLRNRVLDLTLNICFNLACDARVRDKSLLKAKNRNGKVSDRYNETQKAD